LNFKNFVLSINHFVGAGMEAKKDHLFVLFSHKRNLLFVAEAKELIPPQHMWEGGQLPLGSYPPSAALLAPPPSGGIDGGSEAPARGFN
jgi:hypothetical protein